uniref:Transglycosylase SLT domain-containing protein n=1 Tax=viral metagenome TaxID=1070528 RepID=A0A6H1ZWD9_9ZZZZ
MINPADLKKHVIIPVLQKLDRSSDSAIKLILGTAAQESAMGFHLAQMAGGPAKGIYQMETATHADIWKNYLAYYQIIRTEVKNLLITKLYDSSYFMSNKGTLIEYPSALEMCGNLYYATAMCRVFYFRVKEPLPKANDIAGMAHYWKTYYNTAQGKGTEEEFIANYKKFQIDKI